MPNTRVFALFIRIGIHWRTREVAPQLTALAQLPWNHSLSSLDAWRCDNNRAVLNAVFWMPFSDLGITDHLTRQARDRQTSTRKAIKTACCVV